MRFTWEIYPPDLLERFTQKVCSEGVLFIFKILAFEKKNVQNPEKTYLKFTAHLETSAISGLGSVLNLLGPMAH